MTYKNPTPVAVALLPVYRVGYRSLLAVRRGIEPQLGGVAFPGGYIDEMETAEMAVRRELKEETGFDLDVEWKPLITKITPQNRILIFMVTKGHIFEEDLKLFVPNREVTELLVVDHTNTLAFPLHDEVLKSGLW